MLHGMAGGKNNNNNIEWPESGSFEINPHDTNIPYELVSHESSG